MNQTLSKAQAEALFDSEAILFGNKNGIPEYRIVELFGDWASVFIEMNICYKGHLCAPEDWNAFGGGSQDRPLIRYLYLPGFLKIVSEHNYIQTFSGHRGSEAGRLVDAQRQRRKEEIEAADADEERKERKKRRKAKAI